MKYIDSEIILQKKIGPLVYVYIMIIIVVVLSLIILFILCYYKTYYNTRGVIVSLEDHFYIRVYIPLEDIKYITSNRVVIINKKKYYYDIISIDEEYFTDNINTYQIVKIKVDLDNKYKFNNLTLDLNFLKEDKRIIDYIFK